MSNYNLNQTTLFYLQILLSLLFIITLIISITLSYNEILKAKNKDVLYTEDLEKNILIFNRSLAVLINIGFLAINIIDKKVNTNQDKYANLQIDASLLTFISSLIVLYIAIDNLKSKNENSEIVL